MNQLLTTLFAYFSEMIAAATPGYFVTDFGIATCCLMAIWLNDDLQRAFNHAKNSGCIVILDDKNPGFSISKTCPRRWMVALYIEIHPWIVGL